MPGNTELKRLVVRLQLAIGRTIEQISGERSIILVDDLPAELDLNSRQWTMELLKSAGCQAFVTGIELPGTNLPAGPESRMFHVEHGRISAVEA